MSRVIKFRAWHARLKQMFRVYCIDFDSGLVFCESSDDTRHTFGMIDVKLLEFTGYENINEVDFFDGDIVQFFDDERFEVYRRSSGEWGLKDMGDSLEDHLAQLCVIGNIYQNEDLLTK